MDLISRQAAINVAEYTDYPGLAIEDVKKVTDEVVKGLKQLPPEQQLIPCSSGNFPKLGQSVLCQCQNDIWDVLKWTVDGWEKDSRHCYFRKFVVAWQPLPKRYTGK